MKKIIIWSVSIGLGFFLASKEKNLSIFEIIILGGIVSAFIAFVILLIIGVIKEIRRRRELGIDVSATLETDPEKLKAKLLANMRLGSINENLIEFSEVFRNYPQWDLQHWDAFRAWYKAKIDYMLKYPDIYPLTMKSDESPYDKEKDPLYDPDAPDWEQFDLPLYYDDDDDDNNNNDDDDDFLDDDKKKKDSASDWILRGIGFGLEILYLERTAITDVLRLLIKRG